MSCRNDHDTMALWSSTIAKHDVYDPLKEHLVVFALNTKLDVTDWHLVSIGTANETLCSVINVLRPLIVAGATGFILMHNHPSGSTAPSPADKRVTNELKEAASLLQLKFHDHVIIDSRDHQNIYSFRQHGAL